MNLICVAVMLLGSSTLSHCHSSAARACTPVDDPATGPISISDEAIAAVTLEVTQFFSSNFTNADLTPLQAEWFESLAVRPPDYGSSFLEPDESDESPSRKRRSTTACNEVPPVQKRPAPPRIQKRIRKEIRELTLLEWNDFVKAINKLHYGCVPDPGDPSTSCYDVFVLTHTAPAAHAGAAFLPWHREFLLRFENALIDQGYLYGLPYWDSTLDETLPFPYQSEVWTEQLLGEATGPVGEPFENWSIVPGYCTNFIGATLERSIQDVPRNQKWLYSRHDISNYLSLSCFRDLASAGTDSIEYIHGASHIFVGGHMGAIACSPSDPVFWLHHAFVDCVWEEFRQGSQTSDVEREYPAVGGLHHWSATMNPFKTLINAQGLSNWYTKHFYQCNPRPGSCSSDLDCKNVNRLWCDGNCQCRPKVRTGGDCTGLPDKACASCIGLPLPAKVAKCISDVCQCVLVSVVKGPDLF